MIKRWLVYLWTNQDGFFGIGMGPSKQENTQFGNLAGVGSFGISEGEGDISQADSFWKSILSGDPNKISKILGPQTSAINQQAQQQKKTLSEFGNRGGGTNAASQEAGDSVRKSYDSMVSDLTGKAAGALGASGSSLLAAGASASEGAFNEANTIQQQHAAKLNDIFKSITSIAAAFIPGGGAAGSLSGIFKGGASGGGGEDPSSFDGVPAI